MSKAAVLKKLGWIGDGVAKFVPEDVETFYMNYNKDEEDYVVSILFLTPRSFVALKLTSQKWETPNFIPKWDNTVEQKVMPLSLVVGWECTWTGRSNVDDFKTDPIQTARLEVLTQMPLPMFGVPIQLPLDRREHETLEDSLGEGLVHFASALERFMPAASVQLMGSSAEVSEDDVEDGL